MVWVITVGVFLGTLVARALIVLLFSQRNRIREALRTPKEKQNRESDAIPS
jgi:hypothetical protein